MATDGGAAAWATVADAALLLTVAAPIAAGLDHAASRGTRARITARFVRAAGFALSCLVLGYLIRALLIFA